MSWGIRVPRIDAAANKKSRAIAVLADVKKTAKSENIGFCCEELGLAVLGIVIDSLSAASTFPIQ